MVEWKVLELLVETGKRGEKLCYGDLCRELNRRLGRSAFSARSKKLYAAVHAVCRYLYGEWQVLPGSVLISKSKGKPSGGFFRFTREMTGREVNWEEELEKFILFCREKRWESSCF